MREDIISIERESKHYISIDELEKLRDLVESHSGKEVVIDKQLLSDILDKSVNEYWEAKEAGEYE